MTESAEVKTGNKAKFTPGPWFVEKVAGWYITRPDPGPHEGDEAQANAYLMSAAPELYEAVQRWISWCDDWHAGKPHPADDLELARAALAKARGEQP